MVTWFKSNEQMSVSKLVLLTFSYASFLVSFNPSLILEMKFEEKKIFTKNVFIFCILSIDVERGGNTEWERMGKRV